MERSPLKKSDAVQNKRNEDNGYKSERSIPDDLRDIPYVLESNHPNEQSKNSASAGRPPDGQVFGLPDDEN